MVEQAILQKLIWSKSYLVELYNDQDDIGQIRYLIDMIDYFLEKPALITLDNLATFLEECHTTYLFDMRLKLESVLKLFDGVLQLK